MHDREISLAIKFRNAATIALMSLPCLQLALTSTALAQQEPPSAYPSRNILLLIPLPPGGPPDTIARVLAPAISEALGKPVVVENRPGASTSIASQAVARAAPDGYTLLASDLSIAVVPHILAKPGFDPLKDFRHVGRTANTVLTLNITPALPAKTTQEFIALAKSKPGEIKAAHAGIGTPPHLGNVAFIQTTGVELTQVPYRGAALAIADVVGGHVSMLVTAPSTAIALARDGKIRMLGMTGLKRLTALPEVPTLKEAGVDMAALNDGVWFGISAPAGTPDAIVAKLNAAIKKATADKGAVEKLAKSDIATTSSTPAEFEALVRSQTGIWRDLMNKSGVKPE
jgi:tripartite-type tricarboxylate transporter receptor subunit TctC